MVEFWKFCPFAHDNNYENLGHLLQACSSHQWLLYVLALSHHNFCPSKLVCKDSHHITSRDWAKNHLWVWRKDSKVLRTITLPIDCCFKSMMVKSTIWKCLIFKFIIFYKQYTCNIKGNVLIQIIFLCLMSSNFSLALKW